MRREIARRLEDWHIAEDRKPLIIKGVRQCGKTYSMLEFGRGYFPKFHLINFEQSESAKTIFEGDLDPQRIITEISFLLNTSIDIQNDLVIFDELQACPKAITSLKYFSEQMPELALCCAGSLLGLALTPSSFPVGKTDFISLFPLSFKEFLWAAGTKQQTTFLEKLSLGDSIPEVVHNKLWEHFKHYCITGGLPEVVKTFIEKREDLFSAFSEARVKQHALINGYYADIAKHAGKTNAMHIERVFTNIPAQLTKTRDSQAPKYQFKNVVPGIDRYQGLVSAIDWLIKAGMTIKVPVVTQNEPPLMANSKESAFKLYAFDVGILGAMANLAPKEILDYQFGTYKGYMAENYIAEQLFSMEIPIFCWQYARSEIEFLIEEEGKVIPVEVKAGHIKRAKSLDKYELKYSPLYSMIISATNQYVQTKSSRIICPLYAINSHLKK